MSAFVVSDFHINSLINFAVDHKISLYFNKRCYDLHSNPEKHAQTLLDENYRSVNFHYGDNDSSAINFKRLKNKHSNITILKACDGYEYQACETEDYPQSLAHAIIQVIRKRAINTMPEYDQADGWHLDEPESKADVIKANLTALLTEMRTLKDNGGLLTPESAKVIHRVRQGIKKFLLELRNYALSGQITKDEYKELQLMVANV